MYKRQGDTPVAIAGVMGGLDSEIEDDTDACLVESANFDGVSVRKTSSRLGLRTDASMRYEKILDPELTMLAAGRFIKLATDIDSGAEVVSSVTDCYVRRYAPVVIDFDKPFVDRYTGIDLSAAQIEKTLLSLGFTVETLSLIHICMKASRRSWRSWSALRKSMRNKGDNGNEERKIRNQADEQDRRRRHRPI